MRLLKIINTNNLLNVLLSFEKNPFKKTNALFTFTPGTFNIQI